MDKNITRQFLFPTNEIRICAVENENLNCGNRTFFSERGHTLQTNKKIL